MIKKDISDGITSEKSFKDLRALSRKIKISCSHKVYIFLATLIFIYNAFVLESNLVHLKTDLRTWTSFSFNFSVTILGFLIAGFTIFATLSKPEMFVRMAVHIHKDTKLTTLKYNFLAFIKIFVTYIKFGLFYLLIIIFGQANRFISNLAKEFPLLHSLTPFCIKIIYIFVGVSSIHLFLCLKTFVFNIYSIVMTSVRWDFEKLTKQVAQYDDLDMEKINAIFEEKDKDKDKV
ncbi:hypothetical protein [Citrobacter freundii]|uniref:hypothetical protein n=1 Tax=Citrobacter freundii TaxID=546 RepID=UPI00190427AC|nr:hypothetical protein [Citrobacter freundii]MBJ9854120.1 hypothetical protein [Citrobacter freundii]